jgi:hypothetical protein
VSVYTTFPVTIGEAAMSATKDKSQQTKFVYSNLYLIYKKGKAAAVAAEPMKQSIVNLQPVADPAYQSLRENLKHLNTLHQRLKAMLAELETLVKD